MRAPANRHNKKSINKDDNIFIEPKLNLKFEAQLDEQNQPLRSKSKKPTKGW